MVSETYLDNLFSNGAREKLKETKGKIYQYDVLDDKFCKIKSGICEVVNRYYDRSIDCDMITIKDIESGHSITKNQFKLSLREI